MTSVVISTAPWRPLGAPMNGSSDSDTNGGLSYRTASEKVFNHFGCDRRPRFLAALIWGLVANNVETPSYEVVSSTGWIEIRQYGSMIVAETGGEGERADAIGDGFRVIADYIFGNKCALENVPMTAPVTQHVTETIAMTAPVTQQINGASWKVRFVMPSEYTMVTLPQPVNPEVQLIEVPSGRFAGIHLSGFGNQRSIDEHTEQLLAYLEGEGLRPKGHPTYAF